MITNVFLILPGLPLTIVLAAFIPYKGPLTLGFVIVITGWSWGARVLRSQTLSMRDRDFVVAAKDLPRAPGLRSGEGGYGACSSHMRGGGSITFHEARIISRTGSSSATVELSTTAVQTDKTQSCSGTAQTVRAANNTWLVDHISINCTPT